MMSEQESKDKAVLLVQVFRQPKGSSQLLFEETALILAIYHAEVIAGLTARKEDWQLLNSLRILRAESITK